MPTQCGKRQEKITLEDEWIQEKVVSGLFAPSGSYPWQVRI